MLTKDEAEKLITSIDNLCNTVKKLIWDYEETKSSEDISEDVRKRLKNGYSKENMELIRKVRNEGLVPEFEYTLPKEEPCKKND